MLFGELVIVSGQIVGGIGLLAILGAALRGPRIEDGSHRTEEERSDDYFRKRKKDRSSFY